MVGVRVARWVEGFFRGRWWAEARCAQFDLRDFGFFFVSLTFSPKEPNSTQIFVLCVHACPFQRHVPPSRTKYTRNHGSSCVSHTCRLYAFPKWPGETPSSLESDGLAGFLPPSCPLITADSHSGRAHLSIHHDELCDRAPHCPPGVGGFDHRRRQTRGACLLVEPHGS